MNTSFIQNLKDKFFSGAYKLALNTTEGLAGPRCLFFVWYEPEYIEELIERE